MRDTTQARPRLWQLSLALLLAGLLLVISLMVLYLNVQAKAARSGAFGCGALDQTKIDSLAPGDTMMMTEFETTPGGPVILSRGIIIQGGWHPKSGNCNVDTNNDPIPEVLDTITDVLVYFDYNPNIISDLPATDPPGPPGPIFTISPTLTSTLTLQQLRLNLNNITNQSGSGVSAVISNSAQVKMKQIIFANNSANPGNGAGLDLTLTHGSRLDVSNSEFNQNFALGDGGGARLILQNGSTAVISKTLFSSFNEATQGAGLYAEVRGGSHLTLSEVQFNDGNAGQTGGGFEIHVFDNSQVTIDNVEVLSNTANGGNGGGGRIVIHSGFVTISNSSFSNNNAGNGRGGGLAIEGAGSGSSYILLKNNVITGNTASLSHPNLYITGKVTVLPQRTYLPVVRKNSG